MSIPPFEPTRCGGPPKRQDRGFSRKSAKASLPRSSWTPSASPRRPWERSDEIRVRGRTPRGLGDRALVCAADAHQVRFQPAAPLDFGVALEGLNSLRRHGLAAVKTGLAEARTDQYAHGLSASLAWHCYRESGLDSTGGYRPYGRRPWNDRNRRSAVVCGVRTEPTSPAVRRAISKKPRAGPDRRRSRASPQSLRAPE